MHARMQLAPECPVVPDDEPSMIVIEARPLRVERAAVAGLSMGGYLAFEVWRQAPGLVRGLAFCDTKAGADTAEGAAGREGFAKNQLNITINLMDFLSDWLVKHICGTDKKYSDFFNKNGIN